MPATAKSWVANEDSSQVLYGFLGFEGTPPPITRRTKFVTRSGINNGGHYLGGFTGKEFTFKTFADVESLANAITLIGNYRSLETTRRDLYWQENKYGTIYVYEVAPSPIVIAGEAAGGFVDGSVVVECTWRVRGLY